MMNQNKNFLIKEIIQIVETVNQKVTPDSDMLWTSYENPESLKTELDRIVNELSSGNLTVLENLNLEFAPTSTFQEHSMANGWSEQYLDISERFDTLYKKLKKYV